MSDALVLLSGGQDSTTCLFLARQRFSKIHALTIDYGQRHDREVAAARTVAPMAGVTSHEVLTLPRLLHGSSPLVSDTALEQYPDGVLPHGVEKTFVPLRNQLFLTVAANRALLHGCETLVTGVCEEDYGGYPDCRQAFLDALERAISVGSFADDDDRRLTIYAPLMRRTKADTVRLAVSIGGCYAALAHTHTAYDGEYPPRGHDHATVLRARGFAAAGVPDPLIVRAACEGALDLPTDSHYDVARDAIRDQHGRTADVLRQIEEAVS